MSTTKKQLQDAVATLQRRIFRMEAEMLAVTKVLAKEGRVCIVRHHGEPIVSAEIISQADQTMKRQDDSFKVNTCEHPSFAIQNIAVDSAGGFNRCLCCGAIEIVHADGPDEWISNAEHLRRIKPYVDRLAEERRQTMARALERKAAEDKKTEQRKTSRG